MKLATPIVALLLLALTAVQCSKESAAKTETGNCEDFCYKGRLEIKGICMNYTIKVLEGRVDPSRVQASWTDPVTGKGHTNVFALANVCDFPSHLQEGDEFYFRISTSPGNDCAVCKAYRDKPSVHTAITVLSGPCTPEGGMK